MFPSYRVENKQQQQKTTFTIRLFQARCDGAQEIVRRHVNRGRFAVDEPHGRKVPEDLVRRRKVPHAVLVLDNLLDIFCVGGEFGNL